MKPISLSVSGLLPRMALGAALVFSASSLAFFVSNGWRDASNIVMENVFLPSATFQPPAETQLAEWNFIDTFDASHPFRIVRNSPQGFRLGDGLNVMGFLGEAGLMAQYGLDYDPAIAWNIRRFDASGFTIECDTALDPTQAWELGEPAASRSFRGVVLHEQGHCRGHGHEERSLAIMASIAYTSLQRTLYASDREGIRRGGNTTVPELDIAVYNRYHTLDANGLQRPLYTSVSRSSARVGDSVNFDNIAVENGGTQAFGSVRLGVYLSSDQSVTSSDAPMYLGSFASFAPFSGFNGRITGVVPEVPDCGTYYTGAIIDDQGVYAERFEGNNSTVFLDPNTRLPRPIAIDLRPDALELNNSPSTATVVPFDFYSRTGLSIDTATDLDFFRFEVPAAGAVTASIGFQHALGDIDMELLNQAGVRVGASTSSANSETIALSNLPAGNYFLRVYGFGSGGCNRQYDISIDGVAPPDPVSISGVDATFPEGDAPATFFTVAVDLSAPAAAPVTVDYLVDTGDGTAVAGVDFVFDGGTLNFAPGETRKTLELRILGDTDVEPDETFSVHLSNPSANAQVMKDATITIANDDTEPTSASVSIEDGRITEGNSGSRTLSFAVRLSAPAPGPVSVTASTADNTATAGSDYAAASTVLGFAAGDLVKTFEVEINGDTVVETDETFVVNLSDASEGLVIDDGQGLATIVNDDTGSTRPSISINDVSVVEGPAGTTRPATFTVTLSAASTQTVTVKYATADGTARKPGDYTSKSGTLSFAPGATSKTVSVTVKGDASREPSETFKLNLKTPTNATLADNQGLGTITNDD